MVTTSRRVDGLRAKAHAECTEMEEESKGRARPYRGSGVNLDNVGYSSQACIGPDLERAMSMTLPAGAVAIGGNAYLFPRPRGNLVRECFFVGHGLARGGSDGSLDYEFIVTTIYFSRTQVKKFTNDGLVTAFKAIAQGVARNNGGKPIIKRRTRSARTAVAKIMCSRKLTATIGHSRRCRKKTT